MKSKNLIVSSSVSDGESRPDVLPVGYAELLHDLKVRIHRTRMSVILSANTEMTRLYWEIGRSIVEKQERQGWGKSIIERLARDLQSAFPAVKGFSPRNIWRMRAFYLAYSPQSQDLPDVMADSPNEFLPRVVAEIPWGHNAYLIQAVKDQKQRLWYAQKVIENGWSLPIFQLQVKSALVERQGKTVSNFNLTIPGPDTDLASQVFKDPYVFDFLDIGDDAHERAVEKELVRHIEKFLLELGAGFAFVGRQVHLQVGDDDFYVDLLFYHLRLRCFVVIELKAQAFKPDYAGQLNFYLSVVDDLLKHPDDKPTIGLLLCKSKDSLVAEYALRGIDKPIGVADWEKQLTKALPTEFKSSLPTVEELEKELANDLSPESTKQNPRPYLGNRTKRVQHKKTRRES